MFLIKSILDITGVSIRESGMPGEGIRLEMSVPRNKFRCIKGPGQHAAPLKNLANGLEWSPDS